MSTPTEHSDFGPSQWHRLLRCPAALQAERPFPEEPKFEAAEGTVFHEMVAICSEFGLRPEHFLGHVLEADGFHIEIDYEMIDSAEEGLVFVERLIEDSEFEVFIERRVDISPWVGPKQVGTADVTAVNRQSRQIINFDWKYGKDPVFPQENDQLFGYALGFWESYGRALFKDDPAGIGVEFIIEQPRVAGAGGRWKTTMMRVLKFGEYARRQALRARDPNPPYKPGPKQCRWCRARASCGAHAAYVLDLMAAKFEDIDRWDELGEPLHLPEIVTPERRTFILNNRQIINRFLDDLHRSAYNDAMCGKVVPGKILVPGRRSARVWKPNAEHKAEQAMQGLAEGKPVHQTKLISPAEAQQRFGRTKYYLYLAKFVDQGEAKPVLADAQDAREPVKTTRTRFDEYLNAEAEADKEEVDNG